MVVPEVQTHEQIQHPHHEQHSQRQHHQTNINRHPDQHQPTNGVRQIIASNIIQRQQILHSNNNNMNNSNSTTVTLNNSQNTTTPSSLEDFSNIATAAQTLELNSLNGTQLVDNNLTADNNLLTMGGVIVERLNPPTTITTHSGHISLLQQLRIQAPHVGIIKVETSPNGQTSDYNKTNSNARGGGSSNRSVISSGALRHITNTANLSTHHTNTNEG